MAQGNFEKEMKKHRAYFKKHDIFVLIFTDEQLADCKRLFKHEFLKLLEPEQPLTQLSFQVMEEFLN